MPQRINRRGRMSSAHRPATARSERRRLGDRFRERLRISRWCLTSTDSAITERAPPGPASRATVASTCRKRTARSRTAQSQQDREILETLTNLQFAMHKRTYSSWARDKGVPAKVVAQIMGHTKVDT